MMHRGRQADTSALRARCPALLTMLLTVALLAVLGDLAGCSVAGSAGKAEPPSAALQPDPSLKGVRVAVGSRDFDEQVLLGQLAIATLRAVGADVTDRTNISGSLGARRALQTSRIDLYYDYTGTGWTRYLGGTPERDPQRLWQQTAATDLQRSGLRWLEPYAPFSNTFGLAVSKDTAVALGLRTVSDLARATRQHPVSFCSDADFASRPGGLAGVVKAYGLDVPASRVVRMDTAAVYTAVSKAEQCTAGSVYTTDGRIASLGLRLLVDDRRYFSAYNGDPVMRDSFARQHPGIAAALAPVTRSLDDATMSALNAKVSVDGDAPADVARQYLRDRGFVR